ncbi:FHA domain-containing protein [Microbacterium caowuchunii]|nr:FHA domain-containing protein [Microbacterium caowuchunii]
MNVDASVATVLTWLAVTAVVIVAAGWHIWYALGLTRVFARHGADRWRAWVPVLNDAEVFRLGRIDPVRAALLLVPVVNLYALVLRGVAAHRLDARSGRGAGWAVLAALLPPVWAMLSGHSRPAAVAATESTAPGSSADAPPPGLAFPAPPAPSPMPSVPAPALAPAAVPAGPAPAASPAPVAPPTSAPVGPADEPAPLTRRARRDADDATALVRGPVGWALQLPSGDVVLLTSRTVVLGRNPQPTEPGVQYVPVSDDGRTVSKHHARLQWGERSWTVTDLSSTNGVAVTDAAGREQHVPADGTAPVLDRFVLGDAVIVLQPPSS